MVFSAVTPTYSDVRNSEGAPSRYTKLFQNLLNRNLCSLSFFFSVSLSLSLSLSLTVCFYERLSSCFHIFPSVSLSFFLFVNERQNQAWSGRELGSIMRIFARNDELPACPRQVGSSGQLCEFLYVTPSSLPALDRSGARVNYANFCTQRRAPCLPWAGRELG